MSTSHQPLLNNSLPPPPHPTFVQAFLIFLFTTKLWTPRFVIFSTGYNVNQFLKFILIQSCIFVLAMKVFLRKYTYKIKKTQADVSYKTAWTRQTYQNQLFLTNPGWLPQSVCSFGWLLFLSIFIFIWLYFFLLVYLSIHQSVSQLVSLLPTLGQSVLQSVGKSVCQSVSLVWSGPTERQMDGQILFQLNHIWSDLASQSFCLSMSVYLTIFSFNSLSVSDTFASQLASLSDSYSASQSTWASHSVSQPTSQSSSQWPVTGLVLHTDIITIEHKDPSTLRSHLG